MSETVNDPRAGITPLTVLMVAYCFGREGGQSLIGVYKRVLRLGLELDRRGHRVVLHCAGRENFSDRMTATAEQRFQFVDWPVDLQDKASSERTWQLTLQHLRELGPDRVVIGEAPFDGALLEITRCAAELEIPLACLDNASRPELAALFNDHHASFFDGLILNGPDSFHTPEAPAHLLQVPPFIDQDPVAARQLLRELGLEGERLLLVLAYDRNVERLAFSVLEGLADPDLEVLFLTHEVEACRRRAEALDETLRQRLRVHSPLPDGAHFGLCQMARLVVGKCAFMQVSECLALHTPVIGFHFLGDFSLELLPEVCRDYAHATPLHEADEETLAAARRFLQLQPGDMRAVHDGELQASERAARFIEQLELRPRAQKTAEAASQGLTAARLRPALECGAGARIESAHMSMVRDLPRGRRVQAILCRYQSDGVAGEGDASDGDATDGEASHGEASHGEAGASKAGVSKASSNPERVERLWGHTFSGPEQTAAEAAQAEADDQRKLRYLSTEEHFFIEEDLGVAPLPARK